jgi:hypothetical protein
MQVVTACASKSQALLMLLRCVVRNTKKKECFKLKYTPLESLIKHNFTFSEPALFHLAPAI